MSTKSTKSTKLTQSRVSARTYRARRRLAALLVALLAICLWLAGANWGMANAVAQAEQATTTSTSHVMDVEKSAVPAPKPSVAAPESKSTQTQPTQAQPQAQPTQQAVSQQQASQAQPDAQPQAQPSQAQPSQAQAQSDAQPTDVQAYQSWLASLPQSLDDIPACQVETGEDIDAEADTDVTVYVPVCRWDASISGNGRGESYVLAYGQRVMSLNYR